MKIGEMLRSEREKRGLSLNEVESALKIRAVYIEALETDRFEDIPAEVYRIGYLKNYARLLGLDHNDLVDRYRTSVAGSEQKPGHIIVPVSTTVSTPISDLAAAPASGSAVTPRAQPATEKDLLSGRFEWRSLLKNTRLLRGLAVAAIVLLAGVGLYQRAYDPPLPPPAAEQQNNPPISPPPAVVQQPTFEIRLVGTGYCWANVRVDGVEAYTGTINPGDTKTFTARESVWMNLGYPKGVDVYYNGEKLPPLGEESPVRREFTTDG